jgi:hypothetical protein
MRRLAFLLLSLLAMAVPAHAEEAVVYEVIEETIEITEFVDEGGSERFVGNAPAAIPQGIARFGPFRVLDGTRAAMVDATDSASPAQFQAMMAAYPGISMIEMIEVPGTEDDRANLKLGRMIRARGLTTYVPAGGSVRSGGVELFLAGKVRIAEPGAEFAVHAWADEDGREATDYPADAPGKPRLCRLLCRNGHARRAGPLFLCHDQFGPERRCEVADWRRYGQVGGAGLTPNLLTHHDAPCNGARLIRALPRTHLISSEVF